MKARYEVVAINNRLYEFDSFFDTLEEAIEKFNFLSSKYDFVKIIYRKVNL